MKPKKEEQTVEEKKGPAEKPVSGAGQEPANEEPKQEESVAKEVVKSKEGMKARGEGRRPGGDRRKPGGEKVEFDIDAWKPKTILGKKVKDGEVTDLNMIMGMGQQILEAEIVDALVPGMETDLLLIGQSKGKFGGGQRRVFRQTQKKTQEGNKPKFSAIAIVGDKAGIFGIGYGKSKETVPAREKAFRNAKLNLIKIRRGCGSWQCDCKSPHSIPFRVSGKCGSSVITLMPAPKGTGLVVGSELRKMLSLAGVQDIWSRSEGKSNTRINLITACFKALKQTRAMKIRAKEEAMLGTAESEA